MREGERFIIEMLSKTSVCFQMEREGPFTALGFFEVNRSTLLAELGTILTYFVILLQSSQAC